MGDHVKILGVLNIVWSAIGILAGVIVLLVFGGLAGAMGITGASGNDSSALMVAPIMVLIGLGIVILVSVLSLPAFIGGIGLMKYKPWSRTLMIVVSMFHLLSFPFGTALGVYGLWVLFHEETKRLFEGNRQLVYGQGSPGI
jgi:hypothetical protein